MSYNAIVARINITPVEGAKTLAQGHVLGYAVAVSNDMENGSLGCFFPTEGRLSEGFLKANDLIDRGTDANGVHQGGYFSEKGKVATQKFMQGKIRSEGFFVPLSYFAYTGANLQKLREGDTFDTLNGHPICEKYLTEATKRAMANAAKQGKKAKLVKNFPEHKDTAQYKHVGAQIKEGSIIYITEKLHGTSGRFGNVPVERDLTWWEKFKYWFAGISDVTDYKDVIGTRRTIVGLNDNGGFYGDHGFRIDTVKNLVLNKDEVIYYEIVGYVAENSPVMAIHSTETLKDKEFTKRFGKTMEYKYGCTNGEAKIYVYRITQNGVELSWPQVIRRCKQLNLWTVPEFERLIFRGDHDALKKIIDHYTDGESVLDHSHIREGVCLRVESEEETRFIKNKAFAFSVMEGILSAKEDFIDLEAAS